MPSKLKKAIEAVKDHTSISLAKVSGNTSNLEVAILKATTHDDTVPINGKYAAQVLRLISSNKIYATACARAIGRRIGHTRSWIVILKSLMLVLRIFQDGDPFFPREVLDAMKHGARILNLTSFCDDSNSSPRDFTSFVRTVALYLEERLECFLTGKLQCRYINLVPVPSPKDKRKQESLIWRSNESIQDITPAMLIDELTYWQTLLDRSIATKPTGAAESSKLVKASFYVIVRESFDLYRDISKGLVLVLDNFFQLQYQNCVAALGICLKAIKQFKELEEFYKFCKEIGAGRMSEYPTVQIISEELIQNLQKYLNDQSACEPNAKLQNQTTTSEENSSSSNVGMQQTSLVDLISVAPTEMAVVTASPISINLGAYSSSPEWDSAQVCDTRSTQSFRDLVSLDEWPEKDEHDHHLNQQRKQQEKQRVSTHSSDSGNWEVALVATLAPPISEKFTNTFSAFPNPPPQTLHKNHTVTGNAPIDLIEMSHHNNPFLHDPMELSRTLKHHSPISLPPFQVPPSFSMQNLNQTTPSTVQNGNYPFVNFLGEEKWHWNSSMDQQKLVQEQQLWVQNQRKILGKNLI